MKSYSKSNCSPNILAKKIYLLLVAMSNDKMVWILLLLILWTTTPSTQGFVIPSAVAVVVHSLTRSSSQLFQIPDTNRRELAIYEIFADDVLLPLPSAHLPYELRTCSVYKLRKQTVSDDIASSSNRMFGCMYQSTAIGRVGCEVEIIAKKNDDALWLCRGTRRFVVTDIVQEIPYTVAIVEDYTDVDDADDDDCVSTTRTTQSDVSNLPQAELVSRTLLNVQAFCQSRLEQVQLTELSPLEASILEEQIGIDPYLQQQATVAVAEEKVVLIEAFAASPDAIALPFLAADLCDLQDNTVRQKLLELQSSRQRLILIYERTREALGMLRARQLATSITDQSDDLTKDLRVGRPALPQWAKNIHKGMQIEYFWNEEYQWVRGTVVKEPQMNNMQDESMIVTVHFEDDDSIHALPFSADEKARWRPVRR